MGSIFIFPCHFPGSYIIFVLQYIKIMKAHSLGSGYLEQQAHEKWPVSKWTKYISIAYFTEAVILFLVSFLLFFIKRTTGTDPHMVSGAFDGTTQLTFFIAVNLLAMVTAVSGYYLYRFTGAQSHHESSGEFLRLYFKIMGISNIPVFCAAIAVILYLISL